MGRESGDSPQEQIGPYRIGERLGTGGMGEVYRGFDERLERPVALKRIKPEGGDDDRARERFRREAKAAARLSHSSIVQVHDWIETDEGDWFVMEMVEGRSLRDLTAEGPVESAVVIRLGLDITAGLMVAHDAGIVHRDLKADNVMVTADGGCKILDFGLAKQLPHNESPALETVSIEGQLVGTVSAMSPEQATGNPVDHRSDLFSLGTLLYELATGEPPFEDNNQVKTLIRICTAQQTPARVLEPGVPEGLSELIDQLLHKDPEKRPQNAREVIGELERLAGELAAIDPVESSTRVATAAPAPPGVETVNDRRQRPRHRTGAVIKALLVSDLVDSTQLMEQLGDSRASKLFEHHDRIARDLLTQHGGREIDKSDGFLMLFERPIEAVAYSQAFHQALSRLSKKEGVVLRSRVGIHVGEVVLRENLPEDVARGAKPVEVEGLAKAVAARLMSLAGGRQTLLSRSVFEMGRRAAVGTESISMGLRWVEHGSYRFKGVEEPIEVFEVGVEGEAPLAPPAGSSKGRPVSGDGVSDVPVPPRPRPIQVAAAALLAVLAVALIWIAFEARRPAADSDATAGTGSSTPIATRIRPSVAVLGFKNLSQDPADAWLSIALSEMFSTHLAAGRELRLIPGESIARMKLELALADSDTFTADTLLRIRKNLYADYVATGSYLLQEQETGKELQILVRLQDTQNGELVAAVPETGAVSKLFELVSQTGATLLKSLGIGDVPVAEAIGASAALSSNFDATRLYSEGLSKLRSYDALAARGLFEQAVAADPGYALAYAALSRAWAALGYDNEAAIHAKKALDRADDLLREDVLTIEARYYEASALWQDAVRTYQALWSFYPDNLEYGLRLALAQRVAGRLQDALETVDKTRQLTGEVGDDPRIDLTEATIANYLADHERMLAAANRAARKSQEQEAKLLLARALFQRGIALRRLGRIDEAAEDLERSQRLFSNLGDLGGSGRVMNSYALLRSEQGRIAEAEKIYRQALAIHRQTGNQAWVATILNNLADVVAITGDLATAKQMLEESLEITRKIDDRNREAWKYRGLGRVLLEQGDPAAAADLAQDALALSREISNQRVEAEALYLIGDVALARGDAGEAQTRYEEALRRLETSGERHLSGLVLAALAETLRQKGDPQGAMGRLEEAEVIQQELGERGTLASTRSSRATLLFELGGLAEAQALASDVAEVFADEGRVDDELLANALLARILLERGDLAGAGARAERANERAKTRQRVRVRATVAIAAAQVAAAAGEVTGALAELERITREVTGLGLIAAAFEARLALGEVGMATRESARFRSDLEALAAEAGRGGFERIAARAKLASLRSPSG